jgi:2-polyprenyl-3-methyl-5-hydroxy-6-metoxy-1,4-benzoquinol methylase
LEKEIYSLQYKVEKDHWWFVARLRILLRYLDVKMPASSSVKLLDVGCGTGAVLEALAKRYDAHGIDSSPDAVAFCRERGLANMKVGLLEDVSENCSFDILTFFDVVEHVADDAGLLRNAYRILKPGGRILITVPAFPSLWSRHDEILHHQRRYTRAQLRSLVQGAGFHIHYLTFFNTLLFPAAVVKRFAAKLSGSSEANDLQIPGGSVNGALRTIFAAERFALPNVSLPFGLSLLCWGEKRSS